VYKICEFSGDFKMVLSCATNYYNRLKSCLPQLPSINTDRLKVFSKWCPTNKNARKILAISTLGTGAIYVLSRLEVSDNDYVYNANVFSVVSAGLYSAAVNDPACMHGALIISNLTGLFFRTLSPLYIIPVYCLTAELLTKVIHIDDKSETSGLSSQPSVNFNSSIKDPSNDEKVITTQSPPHSSVNPNLSIQESSEEEELSEEESEGESKIQRGRLDFLRLWKEIQNSWPGNDQKNKTAALVYHPKIEAKSKKPFVDLLPRLISHLDQECCIQKRAREELAKQVAFHYENVKNSPLLTKKHIALYGPKNCGMVPIVCAIAEELGIPVVEAFVNTNVKDLGEKIKNLNQEYILLEHLDEQSFPNKDSITEETQNLWYRPSRCLNIFISNRKMAANDEKKRLIPDLHKDLRDECNEAIQFGPLTKEDHKVLLYQKGNPNSFYRLQEELKKTNRLLNIDEIPATIVEKCLQRIIKSSDPDEPAKVIKDLLSFILYQYPHEDTKTITAIAVQLNSLPSNFTASELTMTGMKAVLDERIVGQDAAKQTMIEAIFFHQQSSTNEDDVKLLKGNVLLIGPSGSGKTFIVETIARHLNIPMASMDLSRVTREGYIGPKISEVFVSLIEAANGDVEKASKGIVFFDEADKIFEDALNGKNDITGLAIQNQLLCMLQGDTLRVGQDRYDQGGKSLKTENILFILAGAFHKQTMASQGEQLDDEQLIAGGIRPEFLGRIGYISQLTALTRDQIKKIITHGPNAVLTAWKKMFEKYGFQLVIKEETLEQIVTNAMQKQTGARGLQYEVRLKLSKLLATHIQEQENSGTSPIEGELKLIEV
jgi:ATP-dependent Clp protease ATP-binding subunit ClpX